MCPDLGKARVFYREEEEKKKKLAVRPREMKETVDRAGEAPSGSVGPDGRGPSVPPRDPRDREVVDLAYSPVSVGPARLGLPHPRVSSACTSRVRRKKQFYDTTVVFSFVYGKLLSNYRLIRFKKFVL